MPARPSWALLAAAMRAYDAVHEHLTTCECGASWDIADGYGCRWCARAVEAMNEDQRRRLLWPDWAADRGDRYEELSKADRAVWDATRGLHRGEGSVEAWTKRLLEAVDADIVTADEANAALDRVARHE